MPEVCIFLAEGFEEMEFVITADVLRRAGARVSIVSLNSELTAVTGSRGIKILPDKTINDFESAKYDLIVLPGGVKGTENLALNERVIQGIRDANRQGKLIAAICAAPTVLVKSGILQGKRATSHPAVKDEMKGVNYSTSRVVVDNNIITSQSPGTTFEFAFTLVELLFGKEKVKEVNKGIIAILPEHLPALMS